MIANFAAAFVMAVAALSIAGTLQALSKRGGRRSIRVTLKVGSATAALVGSIGVASSFYLGYFLTAGQPRAVVRSLAVGVAYERRVLTAPRRVVAHVLDVDLDRARLFVSPPSERNHAPLCAARTATEWLEAQSALAVVNASFFYPCHETHPLDFYPHSGDPVQAVGTTIAGGRRYGTEAEGWITFWADDRNQAGFGAPPPAATVAVTGRRWLVRDGQPVATGGLDEPGGQGPYPRTALGMDADRKRLWLVVIDGKQPRYSLGLTLGETAEFLLGLGASDAIELDGGGSSTMAARDATGRSFLLSRPCHTKIPMRERPIANALGVIAGQMPGE